LRRNRGNKNTRNSGANNMVITVLGHYTKLKVMKNKLEIMSRKRMRMLMRMRLRTRMTMWMRMKRTGWMRTRAITQP
jgi:hypothetical protein